MDISLAWEGAIECLGVVFAASRIASAALLADAKKDRRIVSAGAVVLNIDDNRVASDAVVTNIRKAVIFAPFIEARNIKKGFLRL
jgi:hypothetical protein